METKYLISKIWVVLGIQTNSDSVFIHKLVVGFSSILDFIHLDICTCQLMW